MPTSKSAEHTVPVGGFSPKLISFDVFDAPHRPGLDVAEHRRPDRSVWMAEVNGLLVAELKYQECRCHRGLEWLFPANPDYLWGLRLLYRVKFFGGTTISVIIASE
jgi:hypothetical protein